MKSATAVTLIMYLILASNPAQAMSAECASNNKCVFMDQCMRNPYKMLSLAMGIQLDPAKVKAQIGNEDSKIQACTTAYGMAAMNDATARLQRQTACWQGKNPDIKAGPTCDYVQ